MRRKRQWKFEGVGYRECGIGTERGTGAFAWPLTKTPLRGRWEKHIDKQETEPERRLLPGPPTWWAQEVTYGILADRSPSEWSIDGDAAKVIGREDDVVAYHLATHYGRLLFLKSKDWEGEREYRHVYWGRPETPDLDVPITESLRGIILGVEFPQVYLPTLQAIRPPEAVIYQMRWNWGHFQQLSVV